MGMTPQKEMKIQLISQFERHKETLDKFLNVSSRNQEENLTNTHKSKVVFYGFYKGLYIAQNPRELLRSKSSKLPLKIKRKQLTKEQLQPKGPQSPTRIGNYKRL